MIRDEIDPRAHHRLVDGLSGPDVRGRLCPLSGHGFRSCSACTRTSPGPERSFVGLGHYADLWQDPVAHQAFIVTLGFVLLSTALELLLGTGIALVVHERFRGRGWVRAAVLIPWAIPTVVAAQMWRFLLNDQYGAINAILFGDRVDAYVPWLADPWMAFGAIVVADVWKTSSFTGLPCPGGLASHSGGDL